jgi:hypothetical protein
MTTGAWWAVILGGLLYQGAAWLLFFPGWLFVGR